MINFPNYKKWKKVTTLLSLQPTMDYLDMSMGYTEKYRRRGSSEREKIRYRDSVESFFKGSGKSEEEAKEATVQNFLDYYAAKKDGRVLPAWEEKFIKAY